MEQKEKQMEEETRRRVEVETARIRQELERKHQAEQKAKEEKHAAEIAKLQKEMEEKHNAEAAETLKWKKRVTLSLSHRSQAASGKSSAPNSPERKATVTSSSKTSCDTSERTHKGRGRDSENYGRANSLLAMQQTPTAKRTGQPDFFQRSPRKLVPPTMGTSVSSNPSFI